VKKKRFSVEQITAVLKQAESGIPVGDVCRQAASPSRRSTGGRRSMAACCRARRAS
jgi:hypothetical protein